MSRDYDDLDEPRPRRRRRYEDEEEYEDVRRRRRGGRGSSGSVTSVGVITIILGSLQLLCGMCSSIGAIAMGAGAGQAPPGAGFLPAFLAGAAIVVAILILIFGALYLVGGIGVIQRRNWGKIMTLVMAGFSGLGGILCIIAVINILFMGPAVVGGPPGFQANVQQNVQQAKVMGVVIYTLAMIVLFTHCIMSYVVLLNSRNAAEFE